MVRSRDYQGATPATCNIAGFGRIAGNPLKYGYAQHASGKNGESTRERRILSSGGNKLTWQNRIVGAGTEDPEKLIPHPKNWRKHPKGQAAALEGAIEEIGWIQDIIINQRTGRMIDGHLRAELAIKNKEKIVPVKYVDLSEEEEEKALLTLDPISMMAEADKDRLSALLQNITSDNEKVNQLLEDIGREYKVSTKKAEEDNYVPPPEIETDIVRGDIFQLGRHRVMCGDSTCREDVELLMQGKKADMVFTDPPYGIGKDIENDNLSQRELTIWNGKWLSQIPYSDDCGFICYHSTRTFPSFLFPAIELGWIFKRMLWFTRPDKFPVHTWNGWMMISQAILLLSRGNPKYLKVSPADQDCYYHTAKELGDHSGHPTEKIVGHIGKVMGHFDAGTIFDPFLGSGTTLIACEQLDRICYGMEISPQYCEVICQRWEKLTGQTRIKIGDLDT